MKIVNKSSQNETELKYYECGNKSHYVSGEIEEQITFDNLVQNILSTCPLSRNIKVKVYTNL
jgi:organic hydroperoxide reductase OsmC/OhrA